MVLVSDSIRPREYRRSASACERYALRQGLLSGVGNTGTKTSHRVFFSRPLGRDGTSP